MSGVNVERFFQRLLQFRGIENWRPVHEDGIGSRIDHAVYKNVTVVRLQRIEPLTFEQKLAMVRPEFQAMAHNYTPQPPPLQKRVLEHFAPGDAAMEWSPVPGFVDTSSVSALRSMGMMSGALDFSKPQTLRMTVWRDYPHQWQMSGIIVHLSSEDATGTPTFYFAATSLGDGSAVLTEHFVELPWPAFPDWWSPTFKVFWAFMGRLFTQLSAPQALSDAEGLFAIASLRSCPRGPPLLPFRKDERKAIAKDSGVEMGGYVWVPAQHQGFNFPKYLQYLMRFVSLDPGCVFDRLDGRKLAPYQAVIFRGKGGQSAPVELQDLFHIQQAAYRRLRGGKCAPKIHFGGRVAFLNSTCEAPLLPERVTERKTFVEWAEPVPRGSSIGLPSTRE